MERWLIRWLDPTAPIYHREATRGQARQALRRLHYPIAIIILIVLLGAAAGVMRGDSVFLLFILSILNLTPIVIAPLTFIIRIRTVLSAADAIAHEVESQTWNTLRALPVSTTQLVKSKYAGALMRARGLLYSLFLLRFAPAGVPVAFFSLAYLLTSPIPPSGEQNSADPQHAGLVAMAAVAILIYSLAEPLIDFTIDSALGMAVGAFAHNRSEALLLGAGWGVVGVAGQLGVSVALALGIARKPVAFVFIFVVVALRYALLRGLLTLAAWRAKAI